MSKELFMLQRESELAELQNFNKKYIKERADQTINLVLEGEVDPIKVKIACKTAMEYFSKIDKGITDAAYTEAAKNGKSHELLNAKVEVRSNASSYDYSVDPVWSELKSRLKAREELLKVAAKSSAEMFDGEDGETPGDPIPKVPIIYGKDNIFITLK